MSKKNVVEKQSSITLCQPSCGYYFSSGLVISETVYSSASHGALYNAASRVFIDGGGKVLRTAALGGMLVQNMAVPGYAGNSSGITVSAGQTSTVSAYETWTYTGVPSGGSLNVYGTTSTTYIYRSGFEYILNGGIASGTTISSGGTQEISSGGIAENTIINDGEQYISKWHK